ncbi:MAG: rRNA maturation RNase YbeY, partial [bacterium]
RTGARGDGELTVRVVDRAEMADLNQRYRDRRGATNVLSFRFDADAHAPLKILGDVVICAPVVTAQAKSQRIAPTRHWAHMVIHGALHLCGFDHQTEPEATRMETLERDLLDGFGL